MIDAGRGRGCSALLVLGEVAVVGMWLAALSYYITYC